MAGNSELTGSGWVNDPTWGANQQNPRVSLLGYQHTPVSKSDADATESAALFSLLIPAYTLGANSTLRITYMTTVPTGAAAKRMRLRFGGVVLFNNDLTTHVSYQGHLMIRNRNSMAAQIVNPNNLTPFGAFASSAVQTFTVDFTTDQTLSFTAQWPVAGAGSNVITLETITVEHLYAP